MPKTTPAKNSSKKIVKKTKTKKQTIGYKLLRGMRDILPREEKYWKETYHIAENLAEYFHYGRIETPILEANSLFVRSIGKGTDVVDKEMYTFEDNDGSKVCLRPEATASVVRAFNNHGLWNNPQPIKTWYWGPMFRHDRPQAGRYRQFNQFGVEVMGSEDPAVDAEAILVAYNFYVDLGLPVSIHINSIGTLEERETYRTELVAYYRSKRAYLCEDCKKRINKNPLRLLDCKEEGCGPVKEDAPQIIDWLGDASKNHFMRVLEFLDETAVPYQLDHTLVRGLDYYNGTVFEIYPEAGEEGAQSALGGGGRYDKLVGTMGAPEGTAFGMGFSIGLERTINYLKEYRKAHEIKTEERKIDAYFAHLGEDAKRSVLKFLNELRGTGLNLAFNFSKNSLKSQLELANNLHVPFVLILGQKEVQDETIIIRDMESGEQEIIDNKKIEKMLRKKLETN